jgi:membrane-associated phospholipid phosphatase
VTDRGRVVAGAVMLAGFVVVAVAVALGLSQPLDVRLREAFRPDDVWGTLQVRVDVVVEGLKPTRVLPAFAVLVVMVAAWRRSWAPVSYAVLVLAVAGVPAAVVKVAMGRTDPHHELSSIGSFPSGHVLVLLVCLGGALLILQSSVAWWQWLLVAAVDAVMAWSLLVQAAHWFTDVLGGVLLGAATLALARPSLVARPAPPAAAGAAPPGLRRSGAGPPSQ